MIRYSIALPDIAGLIHSSSPNWLDRARDAQREIRRARLYSEVGPSPALIKRVFMAIQHEKCAFCERKLSEFKIEHDLEHFRPKSRVVTWPRAGRGSIYGFSTGRASARGYYWLAHDPANFTTACKSCNTSLKADHFPLPAGRGRPNWDVVRLLREERPFLIFPIGDTDEDPEDLITFEGTMARPAHPPGTHEHRRAQVTIDFFRLNQRDELLEDRLKHVIVAGNLLQAPPAGADLTRLMAADKPHAGCVRAFVRLWNSDRPRALDILEQCRREALA